MESEVWNHGNNIFSFDIPLKNLLHFLQIKQLEDLFLLNAADKESWNPWGTSCMFFFKPYLFFFSISFSFHWSFIDVLVNLYPNGSTYCSPPSLITTSCTVHVNDYPFDEKKCKLKFGRLFAFFSQFHVFKGSNI